MITVTCPKCVVCGKHGVLEVDPDGFELWKSGVYAQSAFPDMSADERELLITGTHAHCWHKMFGGSDE